MLWGRFELFMFTQIALQPVTLKARSLRLKGLNRRQFRRAEPFGHERQERGLRRPRLVGPRHGGREAR
jgi:hypothetical protein